MRISSITDTNKRDQNEDNRIIIPQKINNKKFLLAAVFDGMGGTDAGEVASQLAKEAFEAWRGKDFLNALSDFPESIKDPLSDTLETLNQDIYEYERKEGLSAGSTAALLILYGDEYVAVNIGDSRIYKFGSKNIQITKDQTLAQVEIDRGNLKPEEAVNDKRSHTLIQSLGQEDPVEPDFFKGRFRKGDSFLICSDGMYNRNSLEEISEIIKDNAINTKSKLLELAIKAKEKGEKDNITGILIEI